MNTLEISGQEAMNVATLISSEACFRILELLDKEELDVSTMAKRLGFSEAHISEELSRLEEVGLVKAHYMKGKRGIRKICALNYNKIIINLHID